MILLAGWVKLDRKILSWEWFTDSNTLSVFIYLLLSANHKDGKWQGIDVLKGQHITSVEKIAVNTGLSRQNVRTVLKKLVNTGEITIKATNKFSLITIVKWAFYQHGAEDGNQQSNLHANNQLTIHQPAKQQSTNHKQEVKEIKNDKNAKREENPTPPSAVGSEPPQVSFQPVINESNDKFNDGFIPKTILAETGTIINNHGFSAELNQAVDTWLIYKTEKRQPYTPSGQDILLQQIQKNAEQYGDTAVINAINESMASNYNGIIWDKAKNHEQKAKPSRESNIFLEYAKQLDEQETTK